MKDMLRYARPVLTIGSSLLLLLCFSNTFAAGDPKAGKLLSRACVACHGTDGNSGTPIWPKIAAQHASYAIKQLQDFKAGRRNNPQMLGIVAGLSEQDIQDLAAYFATQTITPGRANPDMIVLGERLYRAGDNQAGIPACMACHSPSGVGNPAAKYPMLRAQHAAYTIAQLKAFKSEARNNDKGAIMRSIASRMTNAQIEAVAEYMQGL